MLKSTSVGFNKTYVGYTKNIKNRLIKHNSNKGAKSTKGHKWILIFKKRFNTKNEAMSFEYKLKKNRKQRKLILENFNK
ncbi:GIY-YIG nuclease family protein [Candidatus Pelagibacter sp.]|nr:GIY-YIG nuclease family protein [Candidatus Pelagibacter sp.]